MVGDSDSAANPGGPSVPARAGRGQRVFDEVIFVDCHCGKTTVRFSRPREALAAAGIDTALRAFTVEDVTDMATSASAWEAAPE